VIFVFLLGVKSKKKLAKQIIKLRLERKLTHAQLAKFCEKNQKQVIQSLKFSDFFGYSSFDKT